jgi:hypothetical protein
MEEAPVPGILFLDRKMSVVLVATNLEAGLGNTYSQVFDGTSENPLETQKTQPT